MNEILEKYSTNLIKTFDKENFNKIIKFLKINNCDFIEDIISDYLDLLTLDYNYFIEKYNKLNEKYNNSFLDRAKEDMNLLEEFF